MTRTLATRAASCLVLALVCGSSHAVAQGFTVGPVTAAAGAIASGRLDIAPAAGDAGTFIPISVIHGAQRGPVLALIAGVHGMEYTPILALQRLRASTDPTSLHGTVVLVHVANMPSYLGRTIYYSPADTKNLNRVFPGKPDGTLSDRIAHTLTREVIERATHVIDVHCGDGNESLRPYSYWVTTGSRDVAEAGRQLALAFGLDHIVVDRERPEDAGASVYLSNTAIMRGKPALTVESGALAGTDEESIARIEHGVAGVMRHLGMVANGPAPVEQPVWLEPSEVLRARHAGLLYPTVEPGHTVARGTLLAYITDFFATRVEDIRAPFDGEVMYVVATPAISPGEPVAFVAARAAGTPQPGPGLR